MTEEQLLRRDKLGSLLFQIQKVKEIFKVRSLMLVSGLVLTTSNCQIRRWRRTLDLEAQLAVCDGQTLIDSAREI